MNPVSKLTLSADEQQLVANTAWILTKRTIIDKTVYLLGLVAQQQQVCINKEKDWLPDVVFSSTPKIAKGENYLGLPYVLLDYPRSFEGENIFAVRTMFWWGNFFSITLHLAGLHKAMFQQAIAKNVDTAHPYIFLCVNENQWQHHFETDNYQPIHSLNKDELQKILEEKPFIKLAMKFPLQAWNEIPNLLDTACNELLALLKN